MLTLSIVIPAYNEQSTILTVLEAVARHPVDGVTYEVIVVDDGSTDGTAAAVRSRPDLYTHFLALPKNGGKGAAVRAALARATGDYVLFQDADLEYDPVDYAKLLQPVLMRGAEVVLGSRMLAPDVIRVHYFWHLVGNRLITLFFNVLYNMTFSDIYTCYILYRRSLIDPTRLRSNGWEQHAEILCKLARVARGIFEVPISYYGRTYDEGKKIRAHHVFAIIRTIAAWRFAAR